MFYLMPPCLTRHHIYYPYYQILIQIYSYLLYLLHDLFIYIYLISIYINNFKSFI